MFGRLLGFWLDQQRSLEADLMFVFNHHLHKAANLFTLLTQIGIEQGFIAFTPAPQHIVFTAQFVGGIHGREHLSCCPTENFRIRVGRCPGTVTWMGEAVGGAPQQLHAAALLLLCQHVGHDCEVVQILF
ncbi:hypothetical protein D3C79_435100 [compost metagenome]